jgi:hypothetical protein
MKGEGNAAAGKDARGCIVKSECESVTVARASRVLISTVGGMLNIFFLCEGAEKIWSTGHKRARVTR